LEVRKSTLEVEKSNRWTQNVPKEINFFILDNHRHTKTISAVSGCATLQIVIFTAMQTKRQKEQQSKRDGWCSYCRAAYIFGTTLCTWWF